MRHQQAVRFVTYESAEQVRPGGRRFLRRCFCPLNLPYYRVIVVEPTTKRVDAKLNSQSHVAWESGLESVHDPKQPKSCHARQRRSAWLFDASWRVVRSELDS